MSWLFSQALVEAFSEATCSAGEPCAQLNVMPSPQPFWRNDKPTDFSGPSRFGLTCALSTADRGAALLTWYLEGFPARTSAAPERRKASAARAQASGWRWPESFARWDPATSKWRTRQSCFIEGSETFSETWPAWGSMLGGESLAAPNVERPKPGLASGLLPTLTAGDAKGARNGTAKGRTPADGLTLTDWLWLNVGPGMLHPESAEWVMLWPTGWTALEPLGMDRFQQWQQQHGDC
jgi:hypothetical protein